MIAATTRSAESQGADETGPQAHPRRVMRSPLAIAVAFLIGGAALAGGWLWLRDSSLVEIREVTVVGQRGPEASRVRRALEASARRMTTLHVRSDDLRRAVRPFPIVKRVRVDTDFPHRVRLIVEQHVPVASVGTGSKRILVAADGTLLRHTPSRKVAAIPVTRPPKGSRLTEARAVTIVRFLTVAARPLRSRIARAYIGPHGLTAELSAGPTLYFGLPQRMTAKWAAAIRVLGHPSSQGASYLDVRVPERPAAGGLEPLDGTDAAVGAVAPPAAPPAPPDPVPPPPASPAEPST